MQMYNRGVRPASDVEAVLRTLIFRSIHDQISFIGIVFRMESKELRSHYSGII